MSNGFKKGLKIVGIVLAVIILIMILIPILFKDKIKDAVLNVANEQLEATVEIKDFDLSLFSNFPKATLSLKDVSVVGKEDFARDTLLQAKAASVTLDLSSLFGDEFKINKIILDNASVYAKILEDGRPNWDIVKSDSTEVVDENTESSGSFNLNLQGIDIKNADIVYEDLEGKMRADIIGLNGNIKGDFNASETTLKIVAKLDELSFAMGGVPYIYKVKAIADAKVKANLDDMKFTFDDSNLALNDLKASIDGSFGFVDEDGMDFDLKLNAPNTQFKEILSIVPAMYTDEFKNLKTSGTASLDANIKGAMQGETYPAFDVKLNIGDAMFQYPSLPQAVTGINVALALNSKGGSLDNTIVDLSKFSFSLGGNPFTGHLKVTTPMSDANLAAHANGTIDLGMIKNVYPLEKGTELNGVIKANLDIAARMSQIEKELYDQVQAKGTLALSGMKYKAGAVDMNIDKAGLEFTPRYVELSSLDIKLGKNDISATGRLENFIAFALKNKTLKGNLNIKSTYLNLNDFMGGEETATTDTTATASSSGDLILPKNINFALNANFNQIVYDKMAITNANGAMTINNGVLNLSNVSANLLGGGCKVTGAYDTSKPKVPKVNMNLNLSEVSFAETFKQIDAIGKLAPIFENMEGIYSMTFNFNTTFGATTDATLQALNGHGELSTNNLKIEHVKVLDAMADVFKNESLRTIAPKDLRVVFDIKDGRITTKPFTLNIGGGGAIKLSGSTGLDETINYTGNVTLPKSLNNKVLNNVPMTIKGTFTSPKIGVDTKAMVSDALGNVTNKLFGGDDKTPVDDAEKAQKIRDDAKANADKLIEAAEKQSKSLVDKAGSNKIAKAAAKGAGKKLVDEAKKQAQGIIDRAEEKAKQYNAPAE